MQFYENYLRLCAKVGKAPSAVATEIGVQKSTVTRWVKGSIPRYATLLKIADYFQVSVGELVGATSLKTVNSVHIGVGELWEKKGAMRN